MNIKGWQEMVDEIDLRELLEGSNDLVNRDFRKSDLSNKDLSHRDFTSAHLEEANLSNANLTSSILRGSKTRLLNLEGACLVDVKAPTTSFIGVNFKNADLRRADFTRSHFGRSDFSKADLRGTNFERATFQEGSNFEGSIIDESTKFDDASIFRPLARQEAFRFYHVERGVLVRNKPEDKTVAHDVKPDIGIYTPSPAHFLELSGEVTFNYSNNDGRLLFGKSDELFETSWSRAGRDSIHAYVNPPSITGIAIATSINKIDELNPALLQELDFTSRSRTPNRGQILIARNQSGKFIAFKIKSVTAISHGDERDEVTLEYQILELTNTALVSPTPAPVIENNYSQVDKRINELLTSLKELAPDEAIESQSFAGMGHNNPPEETPIDRQEYIKVVTELTSIQKEIKSGSPDKEKIEETSSFLKDAMKKILKWTGDKANILVDAFAVEVGKTLGSKAILTASWLIATGKMDSVIQSLTAIAASLI